MTRVWSYRPQLLHLGQFFATYILGCGFAQTLAIVPGTGISIWPPSGLFIAILMLAPKQSWPWWVSVGCLGELFSNVLWFHSPLPAAVLIYAGNALEAMVGAWLVNWALGRPVRLETLREVLVFVALGAGVAPVVSATVGSATLAWFGIFSQTFSGAWPLWWIGDATGVLIVGPLALVVIQNWNRKAELSVARWLEACAVGLILLGVAALSLGSYLPFAYIIMPPLLWAAVRFEFKGAVVTLALLALITAIVTISGASQFAGNAESQRHNRIMLQLFLAISAFSALVVAAISRQHQLALQTLRQSVDALRDRERELEQIVNMVPVQIRRLTPAGEPTFFNKRLLDYFGLDDVGQLDNRDSSRLVTAMRTFVHPDDSDRLLNAVRRSIATGEPYAMKYRMRRADGVYRWFDGRWEPLLDDDGGIVEWFAISIDIDDEVRAQKALRDRERELSQLVDALPVHIWSWTPAGELAYVNKRSLEDLGLSGANFEDSTRVAQELVHPEDAPKVLHASANSLRSGDPFMMRYRRRWKDGSYRWMEARAQPLRDRDGTIVQWYQVSIDIDDQVQAEEALKTSKRQLEQMIDTLPINILSFAPSRRMTYTSRRYLDNVGTPTPDIENFDSLARDLAHPEDFPIMFQRAMNGFATGQPFVNRFRRRTRDGTYRWIEARAQPLLDADGTIVQWYIISIDIEDEMLAQEALRERERFLWQLVETLPAMIDCAAPNGEPVYRSQQLREFLGYELEDLDGAKKSRLNGTLDAGVHPEDLAGVKEQYARCLSTGEPYARRHRLRRFDGEYRWVETRAAPMRDSEGAIVQWNVICLDIDGEVRMQEELRMAHERLARASQAASLAELSASIAHEVNQPLAAIVANSHACYRWLSAEPVNVERAKITTERVIRDANSAAEVVSRIRALFKQSVDNRVSLSTAGVIAEACSLVAGEALRRRIRIDIDVEDKLLPVAVDRIQIQQVLVNLIRNGMEAMDVVAGEKTIDVRAHRLGSEVQIEIGDRGNGIEFPDQIFEPFFTTKENGMGMGLAICRSIVEAHGGRLWAEKNEPRGARFIFTLPTMGKAAP
ncbi:MULTISPECIES: PAS domain-containing protein [Rhizobium]|uniref:histidine kinase n=1 Tax=Rhizobium tropici TaxID=398 RepID=A0A6P1C6W5_RHITR|nr:MULTISPECIES: PAS domain-containing protein [Rhizobium]AGB73881.1 sensory transduction protein kinase [Rhizobium tropici CIAT 899]MBB4244532.1 PAS domain S-box-containing protein [Rhizobium tropici]MBB5595734.1 PAS domain S-box-containing protein [Rhizobium tropici]MBB6494872.1 PAS domain S-box-containing protein [Rhizobium tropici]NEV12920.1 PAS domain-containing protein [Rhizobium tropici]